MTPDDAPSIARDLEDATRDDVTRASDLEMAFAGLGSPIPWRSTWADSCGKLG